MGHEEMSTIEDSTSYGSSARLPGISSKKKLFDSLFPKWEMDLYPAGLPKAIEKVERHDFIKNALHRMGRHEYTTDETTGKVRHRHRGQHRIGLDRLPISELNDMKDSNFLLDKKLPALTLLDEKNANDDFGPSIRECLMSIVRDLESLPWLTPYEQKHISNTFIVNFSRQFDSIYSLMDSSLTAKQNRKLSLAIIDHIKTATKEIMVSLCKKKIKMQSAALFSAESNGDRLISTFRTMLNRKLNKEEILEIAMSKIDLGHNNIPVKKEANVLKELNDDLNKVTHPIPKLSIDPALLNRKVDDHNSIEKQSLYKEELNKIINMHFNKRGLMPVIDEQKMAQAMQNSEDLIRLITDNGFEQYFAGNVWIEDKITDHYQSEAREILQYEEDLIGHFKTDLREDPILRAHAHISTKIKDVDGPKLVIKEPTRYLKRKGLKMFFDFQKILEEDKADIPVDIDKKTGKLKAAKLIDPQQSVRSYASKTSTAIPKIEILMKEDVLENTVNGFNGHDQESKIANVDFLDENLSRFKEVEELYSEIMKSVTDNKVDKDDGMETVFACPAAPMNHEIDIFVDPKSTLMLRKKQAKTKPVVQSDLPTELVDADGIPISGNKFQIFMIPTKQNISPDLFRKNRKKAMKKIFSSKYHFKYNYGGYIPPRVKKNGIMEDIITSDDYDDFLANTFSDFVPILLYQEKRRIEREQLLEEEERRRKKELEEADLLKKLQQDKKDYIEGIFKPLKNLWNPKVLEYMEDLRDPIPDSMILPANRPGLEPLLARDLQNSLNIIWTKLKMPKNECIDMIVKYGGHKTPKMEESLALWNQVADLIVDREEQLAKLEIFEVKASDPKRFFEKGDPGSSTFRLEEAQKRQDLLKPFYFISIQIESLAIQIKDKYKETVSYEGIPYLEKMKTDYREILLKTSKFK